MTVSTSKKSGIVLVHVAAVVATLMVVAVCDWLFQKSPPSQNTIRGIAAIAAVTYVAVYHLLTPPRAA